MGSARSHGGTGKEAKGCKEGPQTRGPAEQDSPPTNLCRGIEGNGGKRVAGM